MTRHSRHYGVSTGSRARRSCAARSTRGPSSRSRRCGARLTPSRGSRGKTSRPRSYRRRRRRSSCVTIAGRSITRSSTRKAVIDDRCLQQRHERTRRFHHGSRPRGVDGSPRRGVVRGSGLLDRSGDARRDRRRAGDRASDERAAEGAGRGGRRRDPMAAAVDGAAMIYLVTALIVGTLDITYAILFSYYRSGPAPARVLQSVAAGWFGRDAAFAGGTATAAAGLGFHFLIAFTITAIFFLAARRLPWLTRNVFITGPLYGIGVYCVMNYVVIPLS